MPLRPTENLGRRGSPTTSWTAGVCSARGASNLSKSSLMMRTTWTCLRGRRDMMCQERRMALENRLENGSGAGNCLTDDQLCLNKSAKGELLAVLDLQLLVSCAKSLLQAPSSLESMRRPSKRLLPPPPTSPRPESAAPPTKNQKEQPKTRRASPSTLFFPREVGIRTKKGRSNLSEILNSLSRK